ncbi:MAG: hypothetical protein JOS17DRAFT_190908 [Linnemannia elongata]|nr:MAG: hypothetical protein JOS17DRAFT_190908 [Linnemannia elongata]
MALTNGKASGTMRVRVERENESSAAVVAEWCVYWEEGGEEKEVEKKERERERKEKRGTHAFIPCSLFALICFAISHLPPRSHREAISLNHVSHYPHFLPILFSCVVLVLFFFPFYLFPLLFLTPLFNLLPS